MKHYKYLNDQPDTTDHINLDNFKIKTFPNLNRFNNLKELLINNNQISRIVYLPDTITYIECEHNLLKCLPKLPWNLEDIHCGHNQLTKLPKLPLNLECICCSYNQLTKLPKLEYRLNTIVCCHNKLTTLPKLNVRLEYLTCSHNQLQCIPEIPESLIELECEHNQLTKLPYLGINMQIIKCSHNNITELPLYHPYYIKTAWVDHLCELQLNDNPIDVYFKYLYEKDITEILKKIYHFKIFYYKSKMKALIINYVWENIRRPKIEEKYSPQNLIKELKENGGDMDALDEW